MSLTENLQIMRDALSPDGSQSIQMLRSLVEQVQKEVDALQKERDQLRKALEYVVNVYCVDDYHSGDARKEIAARYISAAMKAVEANSLEAE